MKSYPFTSQVTYDLQGLPKYDRAVDSKFLRQVFACYFSDGVFYDQSNRLQVVVDTGMQVKVLPGVCHIQGAIGIEETERTLQVQAADTQDRIDTVVARLDLSLAVRAIDLYIVKGTPADSPQAPTLTRDSTIWELGLANLFVAKNTATVSQERITDTRLDPTRCGQVGAPVQPPFDTEAYFTQLSAAIRAHQEDAEAQIEQLRQAIAAVEGNAAWMMKDLYDPQNKQIDITVQTYTHSKSGSVHEFTGTGANGRALMTADVAEGDTFTVNGKPVTAYMGADNAVDVMAGSAYNGKWVSFIVEGETLNFKGGGGKVTVEGLSADVIDRDVVVTIKQGAKTVQSVRGTLWPTVSGLSADAIAADKIVSVLQRSKTVKSVKGTFRLLFAGGCMTSPGSAQWIRWNGSGYVRGSGTPSFTLNGTPVLALIYREGGSNPNICGNTVTQQNTLITLTKFTNKTLQIPTNTWSCFVMGY